MYSRLLFLVLTAFASQLVVAKQSKPVVIMLSIDGFRYDYLAKFQTTNLNQIAKNGVKAEKLLPVYPSKTFPNHLSIVTGLYPANHGIVHNRFYDPQIKEFYQLGKVPLSSEWLYGKTIWQLAKEQNVVTASYFWPGSQRPNPKNSADYTFQYDGSITTEQRVERVFDWLKMPEETRPQFVSLYVSTIDDIGHKYGVDSKELSEAVINLDKKIGLFVERLKALDNLDVNLLIVSDHGMVNSNFSSPVRSDRIEFSDNFIVVDGQSQLLIYQRNKDEQALHALKNQLEEQAKNQFKVYLKQDIPNQYHYANNNRIPDILLEAIPPTIFSGHNRYYNSKAAHGYSPTEVDQMGAIFIAQGPSFNENQIIKPFNNIDIFPLIAHLLDLEINYPIDGSIEKVKLALKKTSN